MSWSAFIRKKVVYLPTEGETPDGILVGVAPVEVAPITEKSALSNAVLRVIGRGRVAIPRMTPDQFEKDPMLELAGVKTWSAFYKGAVQLCFMRGKSGFEIFQLMPYGGGNKGYRVDESTRIALSCELTLDAVVERIVEEIQNCA